MAEMASTAFIIHVCLQAGAQQEPPSFPSPPKLSCRERFQPGEGSNTRDRLRRDARKSHRVFPKCREFSTWKSTWGCEIGVQAPAQGCNSAMLTWCPSMNTEQPPLFIKGLSASAFLQDRSLFSRALLKSRDGIWGVHSLV